ncbi:MAG: shikimate dehydrogenase [Mesorhizobium sp.]|nr:MAG: shikimate dehydrogenase [Mesorhizobium sp.]
MLARITGGTCRGKAVIREDGLASVATSIKTRRDAAPDTQRILVGLIGRGIQLSRTPAMHEAEGRARGIAYIYRLLDADGMGDGRVRLEEIVSFASYFGFDGLNVTFPYKQDIIPLLDELSEAAEAIGSVNTVVLRGGRRIGHNTDLHGFRESFTHEMIGARQDSVLLLGAGGAGAAIAYALLESGIGQLHLFDVAQARAAALSARLEGRFGADRVTVASDVVAVAARVDGIVNATPVGMAKLPGIPLHPALLRPDCWVADIVYFPLETQLLAEARRRGCRTLSGESMAVHQAARAFQLFTGIAPDIDRMRTAFAAFDESPAAGPEGSGPATAD